VLPILQIGPLAIQLPGLILLAGIWFGTSWIERFAPRHGVSASGLNNLVLYGLLAGLAGARLGYALRYFDVDWQDPLGMVALDTSTLSLSDGLLAGLLTAAIYLQRRKLALWPTLDSLTPPLALFGMALGLAHLASGDAFGAPAGVPWAIRLWGAPRHPSQIYEILIGGLIVVAVLRWEKVRLPAGWVFLLWVACEAAAGLVLEAFRGDSVLWLAGMRSTQVISLLILLLTLAGLHFRARDVPEATASAQWRR
jgi:phosphatidylglycerol:prolipoprotein diacylglycerol transferase